MIKKGLTALTITLTSGAVLATIFHIILSLSHQHTFYPNTHIAGINMGGKTTQEAESIIANKLATTNNSLIFNIEEHQEKATAKQLGFDIDINTTVTSAFIYGRSGNPFVDTIDQLHAILGKNHTLSYAFNHELLGDYYQNKLATYEIKKTKSQLKNNEGKAEFIAGKPGLTINQTELFQAIKQKITTLSDKQITIKREKTFPATTQKETRVLTYINKKTDKPLSISAEDITIQIPPEKIKEALRFTEKTSSKKLSRAEILKKENFSINTFIAQSLGDQKPTYEIIFGAYLDKQTIATIITQNFSEKIDTEPQNARFNIKDDKSIELTQESTKGKRVLTETNAAYIENAILYTKNSPQNVPLHIEPRGADVDKNNIDSLGITELLATGTSNFAGSSQNRRHNIAVGVDKIDGILLAPNEEYSFTGHLGEVSAATGYVPELVIKPGILIKEYGGGICQVSTTVFRGAMNAGLNITERVAHGFPIDYYRPFGTDATIYIPSPDLKFINDTENYILIQGEIEGNILNIQLYGTSDNRQVSLDGPHQFNHGWAGPGSMKTSWTQNVTFSDSTTRSKTFWSSYKSPESFDKQ